MGLFLTTPSTDVFTEEGQSNHTHYIAGEMQGWRRSMEDAHIALPDLTDYYKQENSKNIPVPISLFGVFDGHGGKEVAKFVKLKYPHILTELESFRAGDYTRALKQSFHKIDEFLEDEQYEPLLKELRAIPNPSDNKKSPATGSTHHRKINQRTSALKASTSNFMDMNPAVASDMLDMSNSFSTPSTASVSASSSLTYAKDDLDLGDDDDEALSSSEKDNAKDDEDDPIYLIRNMELVRNLLMKAREKKQLKSQGTSSEETDETDEVHEGISQVVSKTKKENYEEQDPISYELSQSILNALKLSEEENKEDGTFNAVGSGIETASSSSGSSDSSSSGGSGSSDEAVGNDAVKVTQPLTYSETAHRKKCNLPDHRLRAGCTAIVALLVGKQLYVANAGDSRGVICRADGTALALSEDHKPNNPREMDRITSAGGFVNLVGRVNGNLNLSRSLGDLKYKQLKYLRPEEQIITAEPDIKVIDIEEGDQFFVLACDGVWDCMQTQEICDFISIRLRDGMEPRSIVNEIFTHCLADDPRVPAKVGGDNMTCVIVQLNQSS